MHEAAGRLRAATSSRRIPRLFLPQNAGFAPVYDAWRGRTGGLAAREDGCAFADELTNRCPPFGVHSGVRDVLTGSGGEVLTVDERSAGAAMKVFRNLESIDLEPAAAVAAASLFAAVEEGRVPRGAFVLLNVTGGGRARPARDFAPQQAEPDLRVRADGPRGETADAVRELFAAPAVARPRRPSARPAAPM